MSYPCYEDFDDCCCDNSIYTSYDDEYNHMFTNLHSVGTPSISMTAYTPTPVSMADEGEYRSGHIDVNNLLFGVKKIGGKSKWYADGQGNLYNSKGDAVNYSRDKQGRLVFSNKSDVTRYLPQSAVDYLNSQSDDGIFSAANSANANLPGMGMQAVPVGSGRLLLS